MGAGRTGAREPQGWEAYLHGREVFGMRPGLERVVALLGVLGHPERSFRSIHVVGTNGKSSTTRYCEALLHVSGLRSGGYVSPHITGFEERVIVDGRPMRRQALGAAVETVRAAAAELPRELGPVTQFEALTVAAFRALAEEGVEAAAIEAGLGGRLDATNVLAAPVVVVTGIGLEHTEVLGDTREAIFVEKAAVICAGADVVFGALDGLEETAEAVCARVGARAHRLGRDLVVTGTPSRFAVTVEGTAYRDLSVPTLAGYQTTNAALAVAAARLLLGGLDADGVRRALAGTAVPGRLQQVGVEPLTLADGAHNPEGARALAEALKTVERPGPRVGVLAIMRDKAVTEMLGTLLPLVDVVVCTQASERRSLTAAELARFVVAAGVADDRIHVEPTPEAAVAQARELAGPGGSVLVAGSLYLLADLAWLIVGRGDEV